MDYVEEAWRIVDPVLAMNTPVREYEPGTWGPPIAREDIVPPGGWANSSTEEGASISWLMSTGQDPQAIRRARRDWRTAREWDSPWRKWGPYLSERQWGTVREDYSQNGDAWEYFTHDHARSRAYHWGEDGLAGFQRPEAAAVFRAGALEREGPDSEGAALRLEQCRGEPRRGREGVLLLSRFHADPLVHEVAVQVSAGRLSRTTTS